MAALLALLAWAVAPAGAQRSGPIRFHRLSTDQGLSQSSVMCVMQDSRGFVWLCTEAGLNRYDGRSVHVYQHDVHDPASLPNDFVWSVAEDSAGDLWIATQGGGLARWERASDRFVRFPVGDGEAAGQPSLQLRAVLVDRQGAVWVGSKDAGVGRLDPGSGRWSQFRHRPGDPGSLPDDSVYALHQDAAGNLWVGTNGGLSRFDASTQRFRTYRNDRANETSLGADRVRGLHEDGAGRLWIATSGGGLDVFDQNAERFEHFRHAEGDEGSLADDVVHAVLEDSSGRLWVGTRGGLQLREADGSFSTYRHDLADPWSLGDDDVLSLDEDRTGVLWFGTRAGGVARFDPRAWAFGLVRPDPENPEGLASGYVTSFAEDSRGVLWIGTMGGGLHELDRATGRMRRFGAGDAGLGGDRIMALLQDRRGKLWVGTMQEGLYGFDPVSRRFEHVLGPSGEPGGPAARGIVSLLEDRWGAIWIGTFGEGLIRFDPDSGRFEVFRHRPGDPDSLGADIVTALAEDGSGALWVGTEGAGLERLERRDGRFRRYSHVPDDPDSIADDTVYALRFDAEGTLWAGTRSGLSRLDGTPEEPRFQTFTSRDGLAGNAVYGIETDSSGRLWIAGNQGLVRFDPRAGEFKLYTSGQGLQGDEFNFGAHYRSPRGELMFGGPAGFNAFFPEGIQSKTEPPPIELVSFLEFNKPVTELGPAWGIRSLDLGYRDSVISFEFAALDYSAPERNLYAYKLDGFDADWIDLGNQSRVTLTNLDSGRYDLRVRAANADGIWNEKGFALPLRVAPPPWRSSWAYGLYSLLALGMIGAVVRVQRRRAERESEYRRRLELEVRQRTQELGERNTELESLNVRLAEASLTDSLTGLRNRRYLFEQVSREVSADFRQSRSSPPEKRHDSSQLIFLMVDLDWFKPINDRCGHACGDRLLVRVKEILEQACRVSDVLIRWGGDEFLVVGRAADLEHFEVLPERIRSAIERTSFELGEGQVARMTCSIGFTAYPALLEDPGRLTIEQVVALADQALYAAKRAGRNAWVGYLTTEDTDVEKMIGALHSDPEALAESGLEIRRSAPPNRPRRIPDAGADTDAS